MGMFDQAYNWMRNRRGVSVTDPTLSRDLQGRIQNFNADVVALNRQLAAATQQNNERIAELQRREPPHWSVPRPDPSPPLPSIIEMGAWVAVWHHPNAWSEARNVMLESADGFHFRTDARNEQDSETGATVGPFRTLAQARAEAGLAMDAMRTPPALGAEPDWLQRFYNDPPTPEPDAVTREAQEIADFERTLSEDRAAPQVDLERDGADASPAEWRDTEDDLGH